MASGAAVVGTWREAGVTALCAAPLAALNVWPRISAMWEQGAATGNDVGVTLLVIVAAIIMARVPFAMKRAENWGWWGACLLFGLALAGVNFLLAVGAIGKTHDSAAEPARELRSKAAVLDSRITAARDSRKQLPQFTWTTAAAVAALQQAADTLQTSRSEECSKRNGGRGDKCAMLEEKLQGALAAVAEAARQRATTERAEKIDADIAGWEAEAAVLGPIPDTADAQAARIAKWLGRFVDLGDKPEITVADIIINVLAVIAEAIGLFGPRVLLTASDRGERRASRRQAMESLETGGNSTAAAVATAAVAETPASPAEPKKPRKNKAPTVRESGAVREWLGSRTAARSSSKVKPADAYQAYKGWCAEQGKTPVSLTAFGTTMKRDLGVKYEERSKRGFYVGIALLSAPRLVASNA